MPSTRMLPTPTAQIRALARNCIDTLLRDAERNVADNEFHARVNKCRECQTAR